jgi:hypothetical protein
VSTDVGHAWFHAFLFTQAVEVPVYVFGAKTRWDEGFAASAITHPFVWFVIPDLFDKLYLGLFAPHPSLLLSEGTRYWLMVLVAETFAVLVEGTYLRWLEKPRPYLWSLVANMASVALGLSSRAIFGFP